MSRFATDAELEAEGLWVCRRYGCCAPGWIAQTAPEGHEEAFPCPAHRPDEYEKWLERGPEGMAKYAKTRGSTKPKEETTPGPKRDDWL